MSRPTNGIENTQSNSSAAGGGAAASANTSGAHVADEGGYSSHFDLLFEKASEIQNDFKGQQAPNFSDEEKALLSGVAQKFKKMLTEEIGGVRRIGRVACMRHFFLSYLHEITTADQSGTLIKRLVQLEGCSTKPDWYYEKTGVEIMLSEENSMTLGSMLFHGLNSLSGVDFLLCSTNNEGFLTIDNALVPPLTSSVKNKNELIKDQLDNRSIKVRDRLKKKDRVFSALTTLAEQLGVDEVEWWRDFQNSVGQVRQADFSLENRWKVITQNINRLSPKEKMGFLVLQDRPKYLPVMREVTDFFAGYVNSGTIEGFFTSGTRAEAMTEPITVSLLDEIGTVSKVVESIIANQLLLDEGFVHMGADRLHLIAGILLDDFIKLEFSNKESLFPSELMRKIFHALDEKTGFINFNDSDQDLTQIAKLHMSGIFRQIEKQLELIINQENIATPAAGRAVSSQQAQAVANNSSSFFNENQPNQGTEQVQKNPEANGSASSNNTP